MSFDLAPEYVELQATVRKLAQEKIAPRAREIDTDATYPEDVFELFRDAGLLGLVIRRSTGAGARASWASRSRSKRSRSIRTPRR